MNGCERNREDPPAASLHGSGIAHETLERLDVRVEARSVEIGRAAARNRGRSRLGLDVSRIEFRRLAEHSFRVRAVEQRHRPRRDVSIDQRTPP